MTSPSTTSPIRLHIGGEQPLPGWKILNIKPGPHVDYLGSCQDLSQFPSSSVAEVYASHVLEHLSYSAELPAVLKEILRILRPAGVLSFSVPDLEILCKIFVHPELSGQERFLISRMILGGQTDPYDFHKAAFTWEFAREFLGIAGFKEARRVETFPFINDTNGLRFRGLLISLNVIATK